MERSLVIGIELGVRAVLLRSAAVLEGTVTQMTSVNLQDDTATITVRRYFKSSGPATVTITNFGAGALCRSFVQVGDVMRRIGHRYLVTHHVSRITYHVSRIKHHGGTLPAIPRRQYAALYGPTVGDRVRLADTSLLLGIERDLLTHGDEAVFGGGKTIRDGMAQRSNATSAGGALDLVITNAIICDPLLGVLKADIGVKNGRIVGIGKAGNPDMMDGVHPQMVIGPGTEVIAGEHLIATPGAIDSHIHMIAPQQVYEALSNGVTTMIGGGTGPADGTNATTCTPGPWYIARMLEAWEALPVNVDLLGKGNASTKSPRCRIFCHLPPTRPDRIRSIRCPSTWTC